MNIVVCVKYVPDATGDRRFESDNTVDRDSVDSASAFRAARPARP